MLTISLFFAVSCQTPPPAADIELFRPSVPVFGGTVYASGRRIVAADPGTDRIWQVDAGSAEIVSMTQLATGDTPFRLAMVDSQLFVTLRGSGEVASLSTRDGSVRARTEVCAAPRGVTADADRVWVACASGELVTLSADLEVLDTWWVDTDLRDVVADDDGLWVSRFKEAEVLRLDAEARVVIARSTPITSEDMVPHVGWRMRAADEGVVLLHQTATSTEVPLEASVHGETVWAGGQLCPEVPMLQAHLTWFTDDEAPVSSEAIAGGALPVDFVHSRFTTFEFAFPGSDATGSVRLSRTAGPDAECVFVRRSPLGPGLVTGVARAEGKLVTWVRDPPMMRIGRRKVPLGEGSVVSVKVRGEGFFHRDPGAGFSCATCHPEGLEDGHVWTFEGLGARRTQSLAGGVMQRAPFHWDGEFADLTTLLRDVFHQRMGGERLDSSEVRAFGSWLDALPTVHVPTQGTVAQVDRGRALFENSTVGCVSCHNGPQFTDQQLYDVGTSLVPLRTPSLLGIGYRAPFMHDGCADSLWERFDDPVCGGGDLHGRTGHLTVEELDALVAYLETL